MRENGEKCSIVLVVILSCNRQKVLSRTHENSLSFRSGKFSENSFTQQNNVSMGSL